MSVQGARAEVPTTRSLVRAWLGGPGEPLSTAQRALRAAGVAAAWALGIAPAALGGQACVFAKVFHAPCPGCGLTRAGRLLLAGDWRGSLAMHPLLVPVAAAWAFFALTTIGLTFERGAPLLHESRAGRASIAVLTVVYVACVVLWGLRAAGYLGGPVAVY